jgi:hypothetical protein
MNETEGTKLKEANQRRRTRTKKQRNKQRCKFVI